MQEIVITLEKNINLQAIIIFASGLSHISELQAIIANINSKEDPNKEECINLIWIISTTEFFFKKQWKIFVGKFYLQNL